MRLTFIVFKHLRKLSHDSSSRVGEGVSFATCAEACVRSVEDKAMFSVGDEFNSFAEVSTKLKKFEKEQCTQFYVRSSRTIESTIKRAPKCLIVI